MKYRTWNPIFIRAVTMKSSTIVDIYTASFGNIAVWGKRITLSQDIRLIDIAILTSVVEKTSHLETDDLIMNSHVS